MNPHHGALTDVNIWDRILPEKDQSDWMFCKTDTEGNVVSWESAQLNITGLNTDLVTREETCPGPQTNFLAFSTKINFFDSYKFCQKLGGHMAVAVDRETSDLMNQTFADVCHERDTYFFSGFTDSEVEGEWRDVNTGDFSTWSNWAEGQPNGEDAQQCSVIKVSSGQMADKHCTREKCPICQVKVGAMLQMSGVCSQSKIDRFYVLRSESELLGVTSTRMILSSNSNRWEIVDRNDKAKIFAFTNQSGLIPLGKHRWYFQEESCGDLDLNLHREVEKPGHFCCEDGSCIESELVCNNFPDCQDETDEKNCSLLIQPGANYKNYLPSISIEKGKKILLSINTTFTVLKVFDVNEEESFIDILFKLHLEWFDKSLYFQFLKYSDNENILVSEDNIAKIWKPEPIFEMIKSKDQINNEDQIFISRKKTPTLATDKIREIYPGESNNLNLVKLNRQIFICPFVNTNYPFGKAADCGIIFHLQGVSESLTNLKPRLINEGPTAIGQYLIENWTIQSEIDKTLGKIVVVRLVLSRKFFSIFMVTYLPTILMNIVNQCANYIRGDTKYDLIYTINITCMVVLASVYLAVSSSLPSTANIKPVEVWLLFNLAYPVLVIIVNVLLQVR